ncbi:MAG: C39 family peptidase [Deltaproteobacteria bacterium]|nr:C39 family peptidase [Deltaproteobacteria bacterium]
MRGPVRIIGGSLPLFLAFLCAAVLSGCAGVDKAGVFNTIGKTSDPSAAFMIEGVPHFPQEEFMCGPSSLASVLNYYGAGVSMEEVAGEVYMAGLKGSLSIDLLIYAKGKGFNASYYSGGLPDLKKRVGEKTPPIIFVNLGFDVYPVGHYMVVTGFSDPDGVIIAHSGIEKDKIITYRELVNAWKKTDFSTLLVTPAAPKRQ